VELFDPAGRADPERERELQARSGRVEIRPATRTAQLGVRAIACPDCGVPLRLAGSIAWTATIACPFCDYAAPTREFVQRRGWPPVSVIARLG
jgi:hypothetical protein